MWEWTSLSGVFSSFICKIKVSCGREKGFLYSSGVGSFVSRFRRSLFRSPRIFLSNMGSERRTPGFGQGSEGESRTVYLTFRTFPRPSFRSR